MGGDEGWAVMEDGNEWSISLEGKGGRWWIKIVGR